MYLIRHGQTIETGTTCCGGETDVQLSHEGMQQSIRNLHLLHREEVEKIVTTGLKRTDVMGEAGELLLEIPHGIQTGFRERLLGPWEGKLWSSIAKEYPEVLKSMRLDPSSADMDGVELSQDFQARILTALDSMITENIERVGVITHYQVMKVILKHFFQERALSFRPTNGALVCIDINEQARADLVDVCNGNCKFDSLQKIA